MVLTEVRARGPQQAEGNRAVRRAAAERQRRMPALEASLGGFEPGPWSTQPAVKQQQPRVRAGALKVII